MSRAWLRSLRAAGVLALVAVGFARPADDPPATKTEVKTEVPAGKGEIRKVELPARKVEKKVEAPKARATASRPAGKNDAEITVEDWLDVGEKAVEVVNELFNLKAARVVARPVPNGFAAPVAVDAVKQFEQQYGPRLRLLYKSELHLMRVVCDPTRQQFEKVEAATEPELKAVIKECAASWQQRMRGGFRPDAQQTDLHMRVAAAIAKGVKSSLSPEQAQRFEADLKEREARRRQVVVDILLTGIDRKLVLSAGQRDQLREVLDKNWQATWSYPQVLQQNGWYFPMMPDDKILPVLTEAQKSVWRGIPKGNVYYGFELDYTRPANVPDEVWPADGGKK